MPHDPPIHHPPGLTRRRLLALSGAATAATLVPVDALTKAAAASSGGASGAPAYLRRSTYTGLRSPDFRLRRGAVSTRAKLEHVSNLQHVEASAAEDAFSLGFSGPVSPVVEHGISTLSHPELGEFELFVAPVERPGAGQTYEAIVNRSVGVPRNPPEAGSRRTAGDGAPRAGRQPRSVLRRLSTRRTPKGVVCNVALAPDAEVDQLVAWLMRRDRVLAATSRQHVRRDRLTFRLRTAHPLRGRRYDVVIVATEADGRMTSKRARVPRH